MVYTSPLIEAIPTENYAWALDLRIERPGTRLPEREREKKTEFIPGKLYQLEELGSLDRVFRLEKKVGDSSVIMSLVKAGARPNTFGVLADWECERLGLEPRPGMIIFPVGLPWREYDPERVEYDPSDLSTYGPSMIEGEGDTIRYMLLKVGGFKRTPDPKILEMPNGSLIDTELAYLSLGVRTREDIHGISSYPGFDKGEDVKYAYITNSFRGSEKVNEDDICDALGNIWLLLDLRKGGKGISPISLKGKQACDLFEIYWNDCFSMGVTSEEKKTVKEISPKYDRNVFERFTADQISIYWRKLEDGTQKYVHPQLR